VTLVSGPTTVPAPRVDDTVDVRSAADMHQAVLSRAPRMDVIVMAAAVADYTIAAPNTEKIAKQDAPLVLTLSRTKDVLGDLGQLASRRSAGTPLLVGFAAESHDVVTHARQKLERKNVDLIVANDISAPGAGFDASTNAVTLVTRDGLEEVPLQQKTAVAARILDRVEAMLASRNADVARSR
jgi:phosphopantothenoylcysteine decarboxylase / phosphopantothenate---cysteine ligase